MRLIDADALRAEWLEAVGEYTANEILGSIDDIPTVPHEMSAREYLHTTRRMCIYYEACILCPAFGIACGKLDVEDSAIEQAVAIVEKWAQEHPEEVNDG